MLIDVSLCEKTQKNGINEPYAVIANRQIPHCFTKYSPYYSVFGRDMQLPIDDWKPSRRNEKLADDQYGHVKSLAEQLREANTRCVPKVMKNIFCSTPTGRSLFEPVGCGGDPTLYSATTVSLLRESAESG